MITSEIIRRKAPDTVRNKQLLLHLSNSERNMIVANSKKLNLSIPDFVFKAVRHYCPNFSH